MSKRIETIEDLAKIAGAELGMKQGKSKIEKAIEAESTPAKKAATVIPIKSTKPAKKTKKTKKTDTVDAPVNDFSELYNAFELGHIKRHPVGIIDLDEVRNRPNPINSHTRSIKVKDLPKMIKDEAIRAEKLKQAYLGGLKRGSNNIGYVLSSIYVERDVLRMVALLAELKEKA